MGRVKGQYGELMSRIFISYRQDDSTDSTGRIYDHLSNNFGKENIFKDVNSIPVGTDFRDVIEEEVEACDMLLVIIGRNWLTSGTIDGKSRLHNPNDFVRLEIESAIERKIPIIPVLVSGGKIPNSADLPESLHKLAFQYSIKLRSDPDFTHDINKLLKSINRFGIQRKIYKQLKNTFYVFLLLLIFSLAYYFIVYEKKASLDPKAFIKSFYKNARVSPLKQTYNQLSDKYKEKLSLEEFEGFWKRDVINVEVLDIKEISNNEFDITLFYEKNNGFYCSLDHVKLETVDDNYRLDVEYLEKDCKEIIPSRDYYRLIKSKKLDVPLKYKKSKSKDGEYIFQGFFLDKTPHGCYRKIFDGKQVFSVFDYGTKLYEFHISIKSNKYTLNIYNGFNESYTLKAYSLNNGIYYGELGKNGTPKGIGIIYYKQTGNIVHGSFLRNNKIAHICEMTNRAIIK